MEVAFLDTIPKTFQRPRLIRVGAVDKNSRRLPFQTEAEIDISAEPVRNMLNAVLIKFIVDFRIGMLKHMLLALKNTQH
ncbi:hypothetical protein IV102_30450 [bacterium]|nr:hypothetical protein [bacterium]